MQYCNQQSPSRSYISGVSRGLLRDAIRILESEGLVKTLSNVRTFV
ncbi:MAG: GntR family transcriptional regulator [Actinobacteria bacterium]|nr:GntR family transcriptional regulator [Actinomycetota bacterium]MBM3713195.1 GntR family transcriptional regulator [Actinomycetota bacterium]